MRERERKRERERDPDYYYYFQALLASFCLVLLRFITICIVLHVCICRLLLSQSSCITGLSRRWAHGGLQLRKPGLGFPAGIRNTIKSRETDNGGGNWESETFM